MVRSLRAAAAGLSSGAVTSAPVCGPRLTQAGRGRRGAGCACTRSSAATLPMTDLLWVARTSRAWDSYTIAPMAVLEGKELSARAVFVTIIQDFLHNATLDPFSRNRSINVRFLTRI